MRPWPSAGALASPVTVGSGVERLVREAAHTLGIRAGAAQDRHDDAAVLLEQREEEVMGRDLRVAARAGEPLSGGHRLLGLDCESIRLHRKSKSVYSKMRESVYCLCGARGARAASL